MSLTTTLSLLRESPIPFFFLPIHLSFPSYDYLPSSPSLHNLPPVLAPVPAYPVPCPRPPPIPTSLHTLPPVVALLPSPVAAYPAPCSRPHLPSARPCISYPLSTSLSLPSVPCIPCPLSSPPSVHTLPPVLTSPPSSSQHGPTSR
ncbi:hypothetical protein Pcinc_033236 [Petrolisthes cinctipes]|uniref:Uncharacterized protein n=1 Tax=Petrolisthes cinctipes TaxID=88211 RepID=A0AAE1ESZ3_PETCI|nr:hypothetical protein Pcinc_033236 [Petrolisthes cinctipes]